MVAPSIFYSDILFYSTHTERERDHQSLNTSDYTHGEEIDHHPSKRITPLSQDSTSLMKEPLHLPKAAAADKVIQKRKKTIDSMMTLLQLIQDHNVSMNLGLNID